MTTMERLGTVKRDHDRADVRFERTYPRSLDTVWRALTDPTRLADWMGAARVEARVGGSFEMMVDGPYPMAGRVRVWEPPSVLEYTFSNTHAPDLVVRFELEPLDGGTRLILTHRGVPYINSALMLPGWHTYLSKLSTLLDPSVQIAKPNDWRRMQSIYVDHYKLDGLALDP